MSQAFTLPGVYAPASDGSPLAGAKLTFYQTGTTTLQAVYQDPALTTPHLNPVTANAFGVFPAIYRDPRGPDYDVILSDANGSQQYSWTAYPSADFSTTILRQTLYPQSANEQAANVTPTNFSFSSGPSRYGALGDGATDDSAAWNSCVKVSGLHRVIDGNYLVRSKVQSSAFITLHGDTRQNTILRSAGFADYVLEIGNQPAGPNPNVGAIARIRFLGGTAANSGMLHMNQLSHMWRLDDLLFQSCACPALVIDNCWDSTYTNIDILSCGYSNQPANVGAAVKIINGCNNLYIRSLRVEQSPSGAIFVDQGIAPLNISQGKIDQGFIAQSADAITMIATSSVAKGSLLTLDNYSITGIGGGHYAASLTGYCSMVWGKVSVTGGTGASAHILDRRTWGHLDSSTVPNSGVASMEPAIGRLDLGQSSFGKGHASQPTAVTPAVVNSKIFPIRAVGQLSVNANGTIANNTILVGTSLTASQNNLYNGMYLVHNPTGTQAQGQGGARRLILTSFTNGSMLLQGGFNCTLDADWSIEYCGGHYTPNFRANNIIADAGMDLFAVLQTGCTISAVAYQAAGGAAGGATTFTLTAANFPGNTDCTGYFLVDETTGEPYYLNYGVDGAGKAAVLYDRTADLDTTHTFSIVAGYDPNIQVNGASYEWSFAGKKKTATIASCDSYGFDRNNLPLWGVGTTGELVTLPYSASIQIDMAKAHQYQIVANNASAFTINTPINGLQGDELIITIANTSGGALGTITWGGQFKMSAWTSPATANNRSITFRYNGTVWREISRTAADAPN